MASTSRQALIRSPREQREEQRQKNRNELRSRSSRLGNIINEFQPDAVEIENRRPPGGARWTLYTVCALIISAIIWSCVTKVDKIVIANGRLVTREPARPIQSPLGAPVLEMIARFGETVRPGQALARLDPSFSESDVRQIDVRLNDLEAACARLNAELSGTDFDILGHETDLAWINQKKAFVERANEYKAKLSEFEAEKEKISSQISSAKAENANIAEELEVLQDLLNTYTGLEKKGSATQLQVDDSRLKVKTAESRLIVNANSQNELAKQLEVIDRQRDAYQASWRSTTANDLLKFNGERSAAVEEKTKAMKALEYATINVPLDYEQGEYYVLEVADKTLGSVAQQGEPLYKLARLGAALEIEMEVPASDIGKVKIGNKVSIKLKAYPYQKHGFLEGVITTISEGAEQHQQQTAMPAPTFYRARVSINEPIELDQVDKDFRLIPGMVADCEIKVGDRTVIEYFLYPLWRAFESFREP